MKLAEQLHAQRDAILAIARKHGVGEIRIFGSVARGEERPDSDVDLLITVTGPRTPWFPGGLMADLEDLIGRRIDIAKPEWLFAPVRERALRESIPL